MRVGLISDTHGFLPPALDDVFKQVDLIVHAGDLGGDYADASEIMAELASFAPIKVVCGNVDGFEDSGLPLWQEIDTPCGKLGVTHVAIQAGAKVGDIDQEILRRGLKFFIYGHSHIAAVHTEGQTVWINPGSARRSLSRLPASLAILELVEGKPYKLEFFEATSGARLEVS